MSCSVFYLSDVHVHCIKFLLYRKIMPDVLHHDDLLCPFYVSVTMGGQLKGKFKLQGWLFDKLINGPFLISLLMALCCPI